MKTFVRYLLSIASFWSLCRNDVTVLANPLIGEKVSQAKEREFPFAVSLGNAPADSVTDHFCTGTLISKNYVLTAAHCFVIEDDLNKHVKPSDILATIGSNDVTQGVKHRVKTWKTYDQWAEETNNSVKSFAELYHDIAIVTLMDNVENLKPAHISNLKYKHIYKKEVVAVGWGVTNGGVKPRYLRKATLRVIVRNKCLRNFNALGMDSKIVWNHLCTSATPSIGLGCGDSGGPLLIKRDVVVGVNIADCSSRNKPHHQNVHASVKFYRKFIMDFLETNRSFTV